MSRHLERARRHRRQVGAVAFALTAMALLAVATLATAGGAAPTVAQQQYAPTNSSPPTISGTAQERATLSAATGTWSGAAPITFGYQWQRCDGTGGACAPIAGATAATYTLTSADVDRRIRVAVTASNGGGSSAAVSAPTATVTAAPPATGPIAASAVTLPNRLVIDQVSFSPNPVRSRAMTVTARFHVSDSSGRSVSGALVYMIGLPYGRITVVGEQPTGGDGWATMQFQPTAKFPILRGGALVVFVRARTPQGPLLAGASTRRLVQLNVSTP